MAKDKEAFADGLSKEAVAAVSDGIERLRAKDLAAHHEEMRQIALRLLRSTLAGFPAITREAVFEVFADEMEQYSRAVLADHKCSISGSLIRKDVDTARADAQEGLRKLLGVRREE